MTFNASQDGVWQRIADAYRRFDPSCKKWMSIQILQQSLPDIAPERLGDTLAQAARDGTAEVGHVGEQPGFRPLPEAPRSTATSI